MTTKTALPETSGRRLRRLRREREITVTALAETTGVTRKHIHEIEADRNTPSESLRDKIADALGLKVNEIFDYPDKAAG